MCIYQDVRKIGPFTQESRKIGPFIYFLLKMGANHIPGSAEKGGYSARTSRIGTLRVNWAVAQCLIEIVKVLTSLCICTTYLIAFIFTVSARFTPKQK